MSDIDQHDKDAAKVLMLDLLRSEDSYVTEEVVKDIMGEKFVEGLYREDKDLYLSIFRIKDVLPALIKVVNS